jgi:3',5'-cyclic AMP phosphodiesterase CpdA
MYSAASLPCPFHTCAGNHDYGTKYDHQPGKLQIEMDYAARHPESRWKFPSKWYTLHFPSEENPLVKIIVLDSNYGEEALTPEEEDAQVAFLAAELEKPTAAPWTWVAAHHPLYSDGQHGDTPTLVERWGPLLKKASVPLYLCGHDHNMQHLQIEGQPTSFIVSGGGGQNLHPVKPHEREKYLLSGFGFTHIHLTAEAIRLQFIDPDGKRLYGFSRKKDGALAAFDA